MRNEKMKKGVIQLSLAVALFVVALAPVAYAQQYPKATGFVNDFANLLTREQGKALNDELAAFEKKTTVEIAVVTVPGLNNQSIEDYARGIAEEWGVGKRGKNNGIVFLIAPNDRKMRIATASGVRAVLTNLRADQIRDQVVLPQFRANNIPQGVIDGTHAIMQVFGDGVALTTATNEREKIAPSRKEIIPKELVTLLLEGIGILLLGWIAFLPIALRINRSLARKYVLKNKSETASRFAEAGRTARNSDVEEKLRKKLAALKTEFFSIEYLTDTSDGIKWTEVREKLDSINDRLSSIASKMKRDIAFAEKARREGPGLLKKIPGMIGAAEKKLAEGEQSSKAIKYLKKARKQYAQVQSQQSGAEPLDWVVLYVILMNILSDTKKAELEHQYANTDLSNDYSSTQSYGFGDDNGFGGGGDFDGGGASGEW